MLACPEPLNVHIQNYDGPIILHTANCENQQHRCHGNQQWCNYGNQYKQNGHCDTECSCVSKHSYAPYMYGGPVATKFGSGCCPVAEEKPVVYCVCSSSCGSNGYSNNCAGNQGYQCNPNCKGQHSGCC